jgi:hypothetical protein
MIISIYIQAETLNFPLQKNGVQFQTTQEFVGKFKVNNFSLNIVFF